MKLWIKQIFTLSKYKDYNYFCIIDNDYNINIPFQCIEKLQ
jgi:hypothetical protein